jgi:hypothetical protein
MAAESAIGRIRALPGPEKDSESFLREVFRARDSEVTCNKEDINARSRVFDRERRKRITMKMPKMSCYQ